MPAKPPSTTSPNPGQDLRAALRRFIRARGAGFLDDPNITSIGVGYKITDGTRTDTVSVQFTVATKAAPEALEALGTAAIPEHLDINGFQVPTDVLERRYERAYRIVPEAAPPQTKIRRDPVVPGISIANIHETAGTLGCIVYDATDATPLVLSNWHVLHGPRGQIGDVVVQPGPHDDNRVDRNRLGVLKRSHLGVAGDCAVATIEDRRFDTRIDGIGVTPTQLGDPELDDTVITTAITHGIVRRVDVIVKIGYGAAGEHRIGGWGWRVISSFSNTDCGRQARACSSGLESVSPPKCRPAMTGVGVPSVAVNIQTPPESPPLLISPSGEGWSGSGPISNTPIHRH
ncbi:hypothetical protein [Nocardia cyriacigeorgica]|uniref:hypothetical protein n=1 Tax=Nocardia cyriacigeorgica TaxID=135487 RepID=UPI0024589B15|nr:hypothetical protein [Nocardia cyriacigeorgica]